MSTSTYLDSLRATKSFKAGLYQIEDISHRKWRLLLFHYLQIHPMWLRPNDERLILILEIDRNTPTRKEVFTSTTEKYIYSPRWWPCDQILVLFVTKRPQVLQVDAPPGGYYLEDGHPVLATFHITYVIDNLYKLWDSSRDPVGLIENECRDVAKTHFLHETSEELRTPSTTESLARLKTELETKVKQISIDGLKIVKVSADITSVSALSAILQAEKAEKVPEGSAQEQKRQFARRHYINSLIDQDITFGHGKLRSLIIRLKPDLLEKFYERPWAEAMQAVYGELNALRRELKLTQYDEFLHSLSSTEQNPRLLTTTEIHDS